MQDRYAGDVGDFGKFALLNHILQDTGFCLGVNWYKYPDENHNNDGLHVDYLAKARFKAADRELCGQLQRVLEAGRSIGLLESSGVFPGNTTFVSASLDGHIRYPSQTHADRDGRLMSRIDWLAKSLDTLRGCDVVFLDPDNGLEISSCSKLSGVKSGKFAYYSEVADYAKLAKVCVVYHHLSRQGSHVSQMISRANALKEMMGSSLTVTSLRYTPYSPRAYFILSQPEATEVVKTRLARFTAGLHGGFWDSLTEC